MEANESYFEQLAPPPQEHASDAADGTDGTEEAGQGSSGRHEQSRSEKKPPEPSTLQLRRLSEVRSRSVRFLVPGLVPLRAITLLAGVGGLGKTTWATGIAARETRGDYDDGTPHNVLFVSYEDTAEEIWRPRLLAAEGDPERMLEMYVELQDGGSVVLPEHLEQLESAIREQEVRLVIIDPIVAAIDLSLDTFKDQHVRSLLGRVQQIAEDTDCAVLAIGHLNKAPGSDAYLRIANSVAFWNASRSVITVTEGTAEEGDDADDDSFRFVTQVKANWAVGSGAQRWRLEQITLLDEIDPTTGKHVETSRLTYVGVAQEVRAGSVLENRSDSSSELTRAAVFLVSALGAGVWRSSAEVKAEASAEGIAERTLKRAAKSLNVEMQRQGTGATNWRLPDRGPRATDPQATPAPDDLAQSSGARRDGASGSSGTPSGQAARGRSEAGPKGPGDPWADLSDEERAVVARYPDLFPAGTPVEQIRDALEGVLAGEEAA